MRSLFKAAYFLCALSTLSFAVDVYTEPVNSRFTAHSVTWDSRLMLGPKFIERVNGRAMYAWEARLLIPEAVQLDANGKPNLEDKEVFSNAMFIENDITPSYPSNVTGTNRRMHVTSYPDPDFPHSPFKSDSEGNYDSSGKYETYRLVLVGTVEETSDFNVENPRWYSLNSNFFTMIFAKVVVENPKSKLAKIIDTQVYGEGKALRTNSAALPILGMEPSLSIDGRLMIWNGTADPNMASGGLGNGFIMYSFNPNPKSPHGWSEPKSITQMYYLHGAGAVNELEVDGLKFSERYPLAAQPFKDSDGNIIPPGKHFPGAYPWLSWDATDFTTSSVPLFRRARRAGFVLMGKTTNYQLVRPDGGANIVRGRPDNRIDLYTNGAEGAALEAAYDELHGNKKWERIMAASVGFYPSMWNNSTDPFGPLPLDKRKFNYTFIMSHAKHYVEMSMHSFHDSEYILYWPMNEKLNYRPSYYDQLVRKGRYDSTDYREVMTFATKQTQDLSGNALIGQLNSNAQFPFEYNQVSQSWNSTRVLKDKNEGRLGNSVYLRDGGKVSATLNATQLNKMKTSGEMTAEAWINQVNGPSEDIQILRIPQVFTVYSQSGGGYRVNIYGQQTTSFVVFVDHLNDDWNHLSLVIEDNTARVYLNSLLAHVETLRSNFMSSYTNGNQEFFAGNISTSGNANSLLMVDEVSLSSVARTPEEVKLQALKFDRPSNQNLPFIPEEFEENQAFISQENWSQAKANLGKKLFFDTILSQDQSISCATCHLPELSFSDFSAKSLGINENSTDRNAPPLLNRVFGHSHNRDGKARSLASQALLPIANPKEMNLALVEAVARLENDSGYMQAFQSAFGGQPSEETLGAALEAYQVTLISSDSDFDNNDLSDSALRGEEVFRGKARCTTCHTGDQFSDEQFHNIGVITQDQGRFDVTGRESDIGKFRTPNLRNVAHTAPYFHNGSAATLSDVVDFYDRGGDIDTNKDLHMRPLNLSNSEKIDLITFLKSLTGSTLDNSKPVGFRGTPKVVAFELMCEDNSCFNFKGFNLYSDSAVEFLDKDTQELLFSMSNLTVSPAEFNELPGVKSIDVNIADTSILDVINANGVLVQIKNQNLISERFVLGEPRVWPTPEVLRAGRGCTEGDCFWITGQNFLEESIINLYHPSTGELLISYDNSIHNFYDDKPSNNNSFIRDVFTARVKEAEVLEVYSSIGLRLEIQNGDKLSEQLLIEGDNPPPPPPPEDPGPAVIESISLTCENEYCVEIIGSNIDDELIIELKNPNNGSVLNTLEADSIELSAIDNGQRLFFTVPLNLRQILIDTGIQVDVINPGVDGRVNAGVVQREPDPAPPAPMPIRFASGTGCAANDCLWIVGENFAEEAQVITSRFQNSEPLHIYNGEELSFTERIPSGGFAGKNRLTLRLRTNLERQLVLNQGVWVRIKVGNSVSAPFLVKR